MGGSNKFLEQAQTVKSTEELLKLAAANNVELTREQAEAMYAQLGKTGELSDDALDRITGGARILDPMKRG
ncbi:MAG: hypothetical protein PHP39_04605 [Oscillospiraceae bacterium]|nr:hypothetical protein [Oscillospiraceae bacterium]